MLNSAITKLRASSRLLTQTRGIRGLPKYDKISCMLLKFVNFYFRYDPAAAIPMKYGAVYMAIFMGFWGLGKA